MDENSSDMPTGCSFSLPMSLKSRHRSPTFSKKEVMSLLSLVEKHRKILFNKSTTTSVNQAKDRVWLKISKTLNSLGFEHKRTPDSLKIKFDNLKREGKRMSKNVLENDDEYDEPTKYIASLLYDSENNTNMTEEINLDGDLNGAELPKESTNNSDAWNDDKYSDDSLDEADLKKRRAVKRSTNFSPEECNLLLKCVRREDSLFFEGKTSEAYRERDKAWSRVAYCFNKHSPRKRSTKVLRTKFWNMKRFAKNIMFKDMPRSDKNKYELVDEPESKIKSEPMFEDEPDVSSNDESDGVQNPVAPKPEPPIEIAADPLSTVLNGDYKIDYMNQQENKDIVRLKLELLNYELETAKLQRRRVELSMEAEAAERASRAAEAGLRLRAARLAAEAEALRLPPARLAAEAEALRLSPARLAAEAESLRLPPTLPTLPHTPLEAPAQPYHTHYNT